MDIKRGDRAIIVELGDALDANDAIAYWASGGVRIEVDL